MHLVHNERHPWLAGSARRLYPERLTFLLTCLAGFSTPTGVVIMGGYDNKEFLSSVQQFNVPDRNSPAMWKSLPSFDSPRAFASAAVIGNSMYVVGGGRTVSATQQLTFDSVLRCVANLQ